MPDQKPWQRMTLLAVLGYEGAGALVGGAMLATKPDGSSMKIPVSVLHGAFSDFLIPGLILFGLGLLSVAAFVVVFRRSRWDWLAAGLALGGLAIWFFVEIVILRELHWLHVMWGFPVILGIAVALPLLPARRATVRDAWLACGILSSLLYLAMNVIVPMQWPGYSSASRTVSELSAVGAPTRPLWVIMGLVYTLLVTAFGCGVRMAAGDGPAERRLRLAGTLIIVYGALGIVWPLAPMHLRETLAAGGGTFSDTLHIALGVVTEIIYIGALGLAASALGGAFGLYSLATFGALAAFGALVFVEAPRIGGNQPDAVHRRLGADQHRRVLGVGGRARDRAAPARPSGLARAAVPPGRRRGAGRVVEHAAQQGVAQVLRASHGHPRPCAPRGLARMLLPNRGWGWRKSGLMSLWG
jgi:hypothetical protein